MAAPRTGCSALTIIPRGITVCEQTILLRYRYLPAAAPHNRQATAHYRYISAAGARHYQSLSRSLFTVLSTPENHSIFTLINIVVVLVYNYMITTIVIAQRRNHSKRLSKTPDYLRSHLTLLSQFAKPRFNVEARFLCCWGLQTLQRFRGHISLPSFSRSRGATCNNKTRADP